MVGGLRVRSMSRDKELVKTAPSVGPSIRAQPLGKPSLTSIGHYVPRLRVGIGREILHMEEKRVSTAGTGGTRRHDDPPAWMNKALPLEKRRSLLDRAIKEMGARKKQAETPKK